MRFDPEFASIEIFAEYLADDDRTEFTAQELVELSASARKTTRVVRAELEAYGLKLANRKPGPKIRGFQANNHDRWFGPGASLSHGGSGCDQIMKFAGQKG